MTNFNTKPIRKLRWWIGGMLFLSTVINYIDRQTLSNLAPYLKVEFNWTNTDYAMLAISFRVAYSIGLAVNGRLLDHIGTRLGLTLSVIWYSVVSMLTALARGLYSFAGFRFLLGAGESANWPGATKAVSEWFPKQERALATALFDSGSSIGGAIAPLIIVPIYLRWGWRPAFIIPGVLGFFWLILWRRFYHTPETHPRISAEELQMIQQDKLDYEPTEGVPRKSWFDLLKLPQTWGTIASKALTDPVWFFVTDWFPIYLVSKGINLKSGLIAVWIPFIAADLGNFFGGWLSGYLIKLGWSLGAARRALAVFGGFGVALLIPTIFTTNLFAIALLFGAATFAYAAFSTIANVLPADLFTSDSVATVSGMSGSAAQI
ncbi:MAG: MFS transporter, partial [Acidobacteria bacterium]|nr:MFS transporter [Acidobacteriota bacterium]